MLRSVSELINYTLDAKDGEIGRCKDFLFDDQFWTIRYMVADTHKWFPGRRVLISPMSLGEAEWREKSISVELSKEQIKEAPGEEEDAPVTRQYEKQLAKYYGYPPYWVGPFAWGPMEMPLYPFNRAAIDKELADDVNLEEQEGDHDIHLRSAKAVITYHIQASEGQVGHVEDFILDDKNWNIRYMVVDTRNWLPGKKVLVSPAWIERVEWQNRKVQVNLTVEEIKNSPAYDPYAPINREYEKRLYDFYGRPKYWT